MRIRHYLFGLTLLAVVSAQAQEQAPADEENLYALSLEDLMNIPINSASKKDETLFDAPLSSYTITKGEIEKSGSISIMEALKLAPGVIVREQANGMYDIHIRGMENLTRTNGTFLKANSYTLVMIDNRPVFNHGLGGTYWESLPVDINDVERIEIVRGPSSPLFGPNAVTGVINIITKRMGDSNTMVYASAQAGTLGTSLANVSVGKNFGKFSAIVSGNFQNRDRVDSKYYNETSGEYEELNTDQRTRYTVPSRSLNKRGVNGYFTYKANKNVSFDLTATHQAAEFQKILVTNPLIEGFTRNTTANLHATIYGLNVRTSYLTGHNLETRFKIPVGPYSEYKFNVADAVVEYDFKMNEKYTITPGVSYQTVTFDDREYVNPMEQGTIGLFNAKNSINTTAAYIRTDLNFTNKLRVLGGLRVDKFSAPDESYFAYELATTYKFNAKNLIRAAITRSNSGSFVGYNFLNVGGAQIGNQNLKLFTLDMIEVGYRAQLSSALQLDIDVFQQTGKNLTALELVDPINNVQQFQNVPTTAKQLGTTISLNFVPNEKIQFKPFITLQQTETNDFPSVYLDPTLPSPPFPAVTYSNSTHKYTPGSYGGFYFNYRPTTKFNVNLSGYYFGKQTQYDQSYDFTKPSTPQYANGQIKSKITFNVKASYEVVKNLNVFVNARNLLGASTREFYAADRTAGLYTAGLTYNVKK